MFNNQRLRWNKDNGIYISMLEDHARNQFYDKILSLNVKDKHCLEVGFGTGFLSLLALKHGAKHITAYEKNPDRYQLGCHIIKSLGLENQITLINEYFVPSSGNNEEVLFHEIIDPNIWGDGVINIMPTTIEIIPSNYCCDFYLIPITKTELDALFGINDLAAEDDQIWVDFYNRIKAQDWPECNTRADFNLLPQWIKNELLAFNCSYVTYGVGKYNFDPGVDINPLYIKEIENFVNQYYELPIGKKVYEREMPLQRSEYAEYIQRGSRVSGYCVNFNTDKDIGDYKYLTIDKEKIPQGPVLILPNYYVESNGHQLNLNLEKGSCWLPPKYFAVVQDPDDSLVIQQCLKTGEIRYWINS
jgi:hypothetical protein